MARILVVDSERDFVPLYRSELQAEGHQVKTVLNAIEALACFDSERPDLVVFDARLTGMDGLEAASRILSIDRRVGVVFHTSCSSCRDDFLSWLADAWVEKSTDLGALKQAIRNTLSECPARAD